MVEQIQQQREEFTRARTMLQQAQARVPQATQRELRAGGLQRRLKTRQAIAKSEAIEREKQKITKAEQKFEAQVKKQKEIEALIQRYGDIENTIKVTRKEINREELKFKQAKDMGNITAQRQAQRKIDILQRNLNTYLQFREREGLITLEKPEIPIAFQQEFTQEEIGSMFKQSIAPEALTEQQKSMLRGRKYLLDVAEQGKIKTAEIKRYEALGYKPKEAKVLAEESLRTQQSISPDRARQVLIEQRVIAPSELKIRPLGLLGVGLPVKGSPQLVEYGIEKGTQFLGTQVDTGLKTVGVPEKI